MSDDNSVSFVSADAPDLEHDLQRRDDVRFQHEIELLIKDAEDSRLKYMQQQRGRNLTTLFMSVIFTILGAAGFGYFFLMQGNLVMALISMVIIIVPIALLKGWAALPVKSYMRNYKTDFMPKMADLLGGLKFFPSRGISGKIVRKTGVIPPHEIYKAEDCFMGVYKNVKVIFSEARLYKDKKSKDPVFDGIFVLLETSSKIIEGHTILTADNALAKRASQTIWRKFKHLSIKTDNPSWNRFQVFSTKPEAAELLVGEKFLKELAEAAEIFNDAPLSAVLFAGKYIFLAIPYDEDMFEASNMHIPVATKRHAMKCKKEIEQLLEIIDVFDVYKAQMPSAGGES